MHGYSEQIEAARGDADALYRLATELLGALRFAGTVGTRRVVAARKARVDDGPSDGDSGVPRATWLTPIMEVWDKERGGVFPASALKPFSQLRKKGHTEHEIARRFQFYLKHQERDNAIPYESPLKFAQTFKLWDPTAPAFPDEDG